MTDPERLRPGRTCAQITERAARHFGELLPPALCQRLHENGHKGPQRLPAPLGQLFSGLRQGRPFGVELMDWFSRSPFDGDDVLTLERTEVASLVDLSRLDWSQVEPAIFGTLIERGLDSGSILVFIPRPAVCSFRQGRTPAPILAP